MIIMKYQSAIMHEMANEWRNEMSIMIVICEMAISNLMSMAIIIKIMK